MIALSSFIWTQCCVDKKVERLNTTSPSTLYHQPLYSLPPAPQLCTTSPSTLYHQPLNSLPPALELRTSNPPFHPCNAHKVYIHGGVLHCVKQKKIAETKYLIVKQNILKWIKTKIFHLTSLFEFNIYTFSKINNHLQ